MPRFTRSFSHSTALALASLLIAGCGTSRYTLSRSAKPPEPQHSFASNTAKATERSALTDVDEVISSIDQVGFNDESNSLPPPAPEAAASEHVEVDSEWSLSRLETLALENNPAIQQASAAAHKSMGYRDQVGRKPNPTVGYQGSQLADAGTDQHVAFVEQDFVLGDKLARNQNVLGHDVQAQLWEVETQRFRVVTDVRQLYYSALAAQYKRDLAVSYQAKAREWRKQAEERNAAAEGNQLEIGQSVVLLRQFELLERQSEAELRGNWNRLMAMVGSPGIPVSRLSGKLSEAEVRDIHLLITQALSESPELQAARSRLARAQANLDRQEAQVIPNLSVMIAAGRDNGTGSSMINTQVGLPLPLTNRNQGNIAAAHAELCRASQNVRRLELALQSRIAESQQQWESAAVAEEKYRTEIIPQAEDTLELMELALRTEGNVTFVEVLIARKTAFDAQWEYLNAQTELAKAATMLNGLVLSGGLNDTPDTEMDSGLRDQSFSGQ